MCNFADNYVENILQKNNNKWSDILLISGGAAWADHIAIRLFLNHQKSKLNLFLPAKWDDINCEYDSKNLKYGKVSNFYHHKFSEKIKINSLKEIEQVIKHDNVQKIECNGFIARNLKVGETDFLIAFSFDDEKPKSGGTKITWDKSKCINKINFNIKKL